MILISAIAPTTELEAVNGMLSAIGIAPIADTSSPATDVVMAVSLLRRSAREVCSMGWRFNTEFGFELAPVALATWAGRDGSTEELNQFQMPVGVAKYTTTASLPQQHFDALLRRGTVNGVPAMLFYDRARNRFGFNADTFPYIYINPTWFMDFEDMPEVARRYICIRSARQFGQQVAGSSELASFSERDELYALRNLKREEGQEDVVNIFDNADTPAFLGYRTRYPEGFVDPRASPGIGLGPSPI